VDHFILKTPGGGGRTFHHRGTPADLGVLTQMFKHQEYSLKRLRRCGELEAMGQALTRPFILDAGANIGASACWFALNFPQSHIVAFEPDPANFDLLRRNTEGLNVELHQAALGARDGKVDLVDPGEGEWGYRTAGAADGAVPLISVARIVAEKCAAGYSPFIAKIDIEGGEADLFTPPTDWVDQFPLMMVELHDWLMPGQGTSRNFLRCVAERDRDFVHIGENVFSIRNG
jgi:FkbM family methyltransferase